MNTPQDHADEAQRALRAGRHAEAVEHYRQALALLPECPELYVDLGSVHLAADALDEALACFDRALALREAFAAAHYNRGLTLARLGRPREAREAYCQALRHEPTLYQAHLNLANLYRQQGEEELALQHYHSLLRLRPQHVKGWLSLGSFLRGLGRVQEALPCLQRAAELDPNDPEVHEQLGYVAIDRCDFEQAVACFARWVRLRPDRPEPHCALGGAHNLLGHYDQAMACYNRAIDLDPDHPAARWNRTLLYLLHGRWEEGWRDFDQRLRLSAIDQALPHRYPQQRWDGRPFPGQTLLVHHEQGLGDIIQCLRFLPRVKALGGTVWLEAPATVLSLVDSWTCLDRRIASVAGQPVEGPIDQVISLMDLPAIFQTTEATAGQDVPYLRADPEKVARWSQRLQRDGQARKVGLVWAGGAVHHRRVAALKLRACRLAHFQPLSTLPGIRLIGLQKGPGAHEVTEPGNHFLETNLGEDFQDFSDTAAVLTCLDLVITVDTSVAHLAGALGRPTWILLKFDADWRWLLDRDDSPWYPSVRLFRQGRGEGWSAVVHRVAEALIQWQHRAGRPTGVSDSVS